MSREDEGAGQPRAPGGDKTPRAPGAANRDHEAIQREAADRAGRTPGGLTHEDMIKVGLQQQQPDRERSEDAKEDAGRAERWRQQRRTEEASEQAAAAAAAAKADAPPESILDTIGDHAGPMGLAFDEPPALTGGMLDQLKKPEVQLRLAGIGLGFIGLLLLWVGLRAEAGQLPGGTAASAAPIAAASASAAGTPVTQTTPPLSPTARPATPLSAGPVVATQIGTVTSYVVEDVKGDGLRYEWRHSATCASHSGAATATYSWDHPHPPCPDEPFHPSFVTVQVTDGSGQALVRQYTLGSRPGRGQVPAGGGVFAAQSPSPTTNALPPTPQPTTTTRPATGTPVPAASPTTATGGAPNMPLVLFGGLLTLGGLGLVVRGPLIFGGPRLRKEEPKDPCDKEKQAEAEARARREAARKRLERINELRASHDRARADLERAQREEAASKDDRNVSWGEDAAIGPSSRVYTNKDQKARIDRAEAAARAARQAADAAKGAFEGAGNGGEATAAQHGFEDANRHWERADAALKRCLQLNAPPPPSPPPLATPQPPATPPSSPVSVAPPPPVAMAAPVPNTSSSSQGKTTTEVRYRASLHCDLDPKAYRGGMGHANSDLSRITIILDAQGKEISRTTEEDIYDFAPKGNEGTFWVVLGGVDGKVDRDPVRYPDAPRLSGTHMYYDISEENYNAAKAWADGQVENPPSYRASTNNCVDFAVDLVEHAGVTTPDIWSFDESNFYVGGIINAYTPSLLVAGILAQQQKCEHSMSKGKPWKLEPEVTGPPDFWIYECTKCGLVRKGRTANGPDE